MKTAEDIELILIKHLGKNSPTPTRLFDNRYRNLLSNRKALIKELTEYANQREIKMPSEEEIEKQALEKYPVKPTKTMVDDNEFTRWKYIEGAKAIKEQIIKMNK